jgi:hypothetical protein
MTLMETRSWAGVEAALDAQNEGSAGIQGCADRGR